MDTENITEAERKKIEELVKKGHYEFFEIVDKEPENTKTDFEGLKLVKQDWLAKHADNTVTWESFDKFLTRVSKHMFEISMILTRTAVTMVNERLIEVQKHAAHRIVGLERKLAAAEAKIEALEKAKERTLADAFRGTWMPGTVFARGGLVVHDGSLWLSLVDSDQRPGASADWKVVARAGRPGKDATS